MAKYFTQYDPFTDPALTDILLGVDVSDNTHSAAGTSKKLTLQQIWDVIKAAEANEVHVISSAADFPDAVGGVRTLVSGHTYFITTHVDLNGDRLDCAGPVCIRGTSSEVSSLTSTGLTGGVALITTAYSLPVQHVTFDGQDSPDFKVLAIDGLGNNAVLDWYDVNFLNCPQVGMIANCDSVIFRNGAFTNSAELEFAGNHGTIAFNTYFALGRTGGGTLSIGRVKSTATINTRFQMQYTTIVVPSGSIGLNVESAASFPNPESAVLEQVSFGGSGTPMSSALGGTNKSLFIRCNGVSNRACSIWYGMDGNAAATDITTTGVAVPVSGDTTAYQSEKFTHTITGEVTYDGAFPGTLSVDVSAAVTAPADDITARLELWEDTGSGYALIPGAVARVRLPTSGTPGAISFPVTVQALPGYKYRVYIANESGTQDLTVPELSVRHVRVV